MAGRRLAWTAAVVGVAAMSMAAAPSFGGGSSPVRFAKPGYVDKHLAGGEPIVYYDRAHQTYIYSSHEGTTHTLHDGVGGAPATTADFAQNYRNQVNIWTSRNGHTWSRVNLDGTGFEADPSKNQGFSDPDLTQDDGGRVYNTGIDLANDALFSSGDGGRTWDKGTINCHNGDRPWLAGAHKNEVFLANEPLDTNGHTIWRSTDGGMTCSDFGIGDYGTGYAGYGKLYYNRANGSIVEPVIYGSGSGANAIGIGILPHATRAFNKQKGAFHAIQISETQGLLTHFPALALDTAGNIYLSWTDAPANGKNSLWFAEMDPQGKILVKPHVVYHPGKTLLWPWLIAGTPGNASIVWFQYDKVVQNPDSQDTVGNVYVYQATLLHQGTSKAKKYIVNASGRPVHKGGICQGGTTCVATGQDRRLGDYLTNALDARGCVMIATGDTMSPDPATGGDRAWSLPLFIMQNAGPSLTHGSCKSSTSASGIGGASEGQRAPLAALGASLLLGSALLRVRQASVVAG